MNHFLKAMTNPKLAMRYLMNTDAFHKVPDIKFIKMKYRFFLKKTPDLVNPQTFNEKLQYLKLYDHNPLYTQLVDKYGVRDYIKKTIGEDYLIPLLGVWSKFDDINFDALPDSFVLKCTHDSGGIVICRDKSKLDKAAAKAKIEACLKTNFYYKGREWPYKDVPPRIIAEKYMQDGDDERDLTDYKFYCFDGNPKFLYISKGLENHITARISFLNNDWTFAPFRRGDFKPFEKLPEKPELFEEMKALAAKLSKGYAFIRVDLYQINGKIYFSELTFCPCSGFMPFEPEKYDLEVGKLLNIPEELKAQR